MEENRNGSSPESVPPTTTLHMSPMKKQMCRNLRWQSAQKPLNIIMEEKCNIYLDTRNQQAACIPANISVYTRTCVHACAFDWK